MGEEGYEAAEDLPAGALGSAGDLGDLEEGGIT
jgi:hypothetical protein